MRKDNGFVILLVALCLAVATAAAVSGNPTQGQGSSPASLERMSDVVASTTLKQG